MHFMMLLLCPIAPPSPQSSAHLVWLVSACYYADGAVRYHGDQWMCHILLQLHHNSLTSEVGRQASPGGQLTAGSLSIPVKLVHKHISLVTLTLTITASY